MRRYPHIARTFAASMRISLLAEAQDFVRFERDEIDQRRWNIIPSKKLISFVEENLDASIEATVPTVQDLEEPWVKNYLSSRK